MLFSILFSLLQATIAVAIAAVIVYLFVKKPMVFVCTIAVVLVLGGVFMSFSVAETPFVEVDGFITRVAPEYFNGYPVLIITVETLNGEVYTYFSEEEIDVQGIVTLLLFGEEVIDVY